MALFKPILILLLCIASIIFTLPSYIQCSTTRNLSRSRRNALQLSYLVDKYTKYNSLKLSNYGNWCGKGGDRMGDGSYIDKCDLCCKKHDNCYRQARKRPPFCTYTIYRTYNYEINEDDDNPYCTEEEGTCHRVLCECDLKLLNCFRKQPCELNDENSGSTLDMLFKFFHIL